MNTGLFLKICFLCQNEVERRMVGDEQLCTLEASPEQFLEVSPSSVEKVLLYTPDGSVCTPKALPECFLGFLYSCNGI